VGTRPCKPRPHVAREQQGLLGDIVCDDDTVPPEAPLDRIVWEDGLAPTAAENRLAVRIEASMWIFHPMYPQHTLCAWDQEPRASDKTCCGSRGRAGRGAPAKHARNGVEAHTKTLRDDASGQVLRLNFEDGDKFILSEALPRPLRP
jgi:hypothetical protein